jgi:hypothetical protein
MFQICQKLRSGFRNSTALFASIGAVGDVLMGLPVAIAVETAAAEFHRFRATMRLLPIVVKKWSRRRLDVCA